jgi:acetyl esterase/lipase
MQPSSLATFGSEMRKLSLIVHLLIWVSLAGLLAWLWFHDPVPAAATASRVNQIIFRDRTYRVDKSGSAKLDVYVPASRNPRTGGSDRLPGVLAIHGGSWTGGSKLDYGPQVARLTRHGFVVFVADYQLARPAAPSWPQALEDSREAVRWIRRHADEFRVDPNRLVAMGSGAGAHLALLLGTLHPDREPDDVSSRVQAVVSLYGPVDLPRLVTSRRLSRDPVSLLLGQGPLEWSARAQDASPLEHVSRDDSPTLFFHGSDDLWVPLDQSQRMAERLSAEGVLERLVVTTGSRHGFEMLVRFPESRDLLPEILAFLDSVWQVPLHGPH